jgi:hypothetical protein
MLMQQLIHQNLWHLIEGNQWIDPDDLFSAIEAEAGHLPLDFRTRLLIRDSLNALDHHWGREGLRRRLAASAEKEQLELIWHEELGEKTPPICNRKPS